MKLHYRFSRQVTVWLACCGVVGFATACLVTAGCNGTSRADAAAPQPPSGTTDQRVERVTAGTPQRKTLELYTTQPAAIRAFEESPLHTRVSGYVRSVHVDIGDRVEQGHVLIEIEAPELHDDVVRYEALVAQAEAQQGQAEAAVAAAEAAVKTSEARLVGFEAGVARTTAEQQRWKAEYERIRDLAGRGSVSAKLVDETLNQFRAAEASGAEAEAAIVSAAAGIDEARANLRRAEADRVAAAAQLEVTKAELRRARTMAGYTEITAPFAGVVTRRRVDTGHSVYAVSESIQPLLVIARDDVIRVVADIPETEAEWVTSDGDQPDPAVVTIQGIAGRSFESHVARTSWSLDPASRSLRTEIDLPNDQRQLRAGMYATVRIRLERREDVLTLPVTALVPDGASMRCCVVANGRIEYRPVETGLRSGAEIEIVSGLTEGNMVVLARAGGLIEGQPVEVIAPAS
jgi:HlyD family secretion protein